MTACASALEMTCWRLAGSQDRHRADVARSAVPVPRAFSLRSRRALSTDCAPGATGHDASCALTESLSRVPCW